MTVTVEGAKSWKPQAAELLDTVRLAYICPTCRRAWELNIQADGWEQPIVMEGEDATGQRPYANGTTPEVRAWEDRRAAGLIEHMAMVEFPTQVWCHQCRKGADVVIVRQ